ncbi:MULTISPECIES: 5-formyltetrahydrofolate cyclo-ligase [unclassified Crossiella]|uniref:5-formyltetrahydrofolate cyclo-ligase n=1 Tax=unclassified Crossiella TaxID=2620835 RepID=UPI002000317B|nr:MULTISPECIES: 5-formyltetrahydrofolate cyclo-ligase [unclassified Crossiella]MCK2245459.1 5-formyltetrahydrofolate cyclo-ligase [Crossiella sp. S99.2]MCK2259111.1 5-formyltetrahydrofolate cyclo-ligase [Crossiella sp. S99.1]
MSGELDRVKQAIRERVWNTLDQAAVAAPRGAHGRIPDFQGATEAAQRLAQLSVWQRARVIKAVPDRPQLPVRVRALEDGKLVYMAVSKLAHRLPFYKLDPRELKAPFTEVASNEGAASVAPKVGVDTMSAVDLVVCGSVAVNRAGARLGKGAGYADLELAFLQEAGLIGPATMIVTTVHPLQVLDEPFPEAAHDFRMNLIVTPEEVIECGPSPRPAGVLWEQLSEEKIATIPALAAHATRRR